MTFNFGLVLIGYLSTCASSILRTHSWGSPHHIHHHIPGRLAMLCKAMYNEYFSILTNWLPFHLGSGFHNHCHLYHHLPPPPATNFEDNHFAVFQSFNNLIDLKIEEAIYIKQKNIFIIVEYMKCPHFWKSSNNYYVWVTVQFRYFKGTVHIRYFFIYFRATIPFT